MAGMEQVMEQQLIQVAKVMEDQIDAEMEKMDKMDEDDFEALKQKRLQALKKSQKQNQEWMALGHGKYEELASEPEFFEACKKSPRVVCHFYRDSTFRCKIVDKHMALLALKHTETRFVKIDVERCPFLVQRLKIVVLPTICLARDSKTVDYIVGFDDLGGTDEFSTEMLEWRIARAECVNYSGDLLTPPNQGGSQKKNLLGSQPKKTIRGKEDDSSDDDY